MLGKLIIGLVLSALLLVAGIALFSREQPADTSIAVARGPIAETVTVTGQVQPVDAVDLSFQSGGRITQVYAHVGDVVTPGTVLAVIDNAENSAQLRNAQAALLARQAELDALLIGARPEDISIAEAQLAQAQQDVRNAYDDAYRTFQTALWDEEQAFHAQLDAGIFTEVGTYSDRQFKLTFGCFCGGLDLTVNDERGQVERDLAEWHSELIAAATASQEQLVISLQHATGYLRYAKLTLDNLADVINHPTVGLEPATQTAYALTVSTARSTLITAQGAVADQLTSIQAAELTEQRLTAELQKLRNGSTQQEIDAQRAAVLSAQAQVDQIRALIEKNVITSPIAGTVTRVDAKVGQSATPNQELISVVSVSALELMANVPEVDIGKIAVGNRIDFTVDALPGETFSTSVTFIDPAETVIDGVINYQVKASLPPDGGRLKSGLTANMDIRTRFVTDALILPQFAIIQNDAGTFVRLLSDDGTRDVPVTLGIRSMDGMVQIVSGVAEGDRVVNVGLKSSQ